MDLVDISKNIMVIVLALVGIIISIFTYIRRGRLKIGSFEVKFDQDYEAKKLLDELQSTPEQKVEKDTTPSDRTYALLRQYHSHQTLLVKQMIGIK